MCLGTHRRSVCFCLAFFTAVVQWKFLYCCWGKKNRLGAELAELAIWLLRCLMLLFRDLRTANELSLLLDGSKGNNSGF
ncbi:hypothetical protein J3E69DRAFT_344541 [Trichoderma sp. SZMC 28015]